jgi:DNA-binding NarL/FixJ family response regulator
MQPGLIAALTGNARASFAVGDRAAGLQALRRAREISDEIGATVRRQHIHALAARAGMQLGTEPVTRGDHPFTRREREVLMLLVAGSTNRQIAEHLFIAEKTASVHVSNILAKLGVPNRGQAVAAARGRGLV